VEHLEKPIFIISGVPGAGKTSVARALVQRFEHGIYIPVDDLREWVISGRADPLPVWTSDTTKQFRLAFKAAAFLSRLYSKAGFVVSVEQVLFPGDVSRYFTSKLKGLRVVKVFLDTDLHTAISRNRDRLTKDFAPEILTGAINYMYPVLKKEIYNEEDWMIVDNSKMNIDETVNFILMHLE
jgi:adenylylsulfate kinase-like enzyme